MVLINSKQQVNNNNKASRPKQFGLMHCKLYAYENTKLKIKTGNDYEKKILHKFNMSNTF